MKLLLVFDVVGWCWERKSLALQKYLSEHIEKIRIMPLKRFLKNPNKILDSFDTVHMFGWRFATQWADKVSATVAKYNYDDPKNGVKKSDLNKFRGIATTCQDLYNELSFVKNRCCLPNGVDHEIFYPIDRSKRNIVTIGFVGKPVWEFPWKRCGSKLQYYGQGAMWPIIKRKVEELIPQARTIDLARMPSNAEDTDAVVKFYHECDIILNFNYKIGTPNPLMEGAACGCAIVSTLSGVAPEFENIRKVEWSKNPDHDKAAEETAHKIVMECATMLDRKELEFYSHAVRKEIEDNWTWEKRALAWLPFLKRTRWK